MGSRSGSDVVGLGGSGEADIVEDDEGSELRVVVETCAVMVCNRCLREMPYGYDVGVD